MDRWKRAMARATFVGINAVTEASNRSGLPVISTGRPFSFYRDVFFRGDPEDAIFEQLQGEVVVDVGCGLTPYTPDSMFQACWAKGVEFYGVDPKLGGTLKFGPFDRLKVAATRGHGIDPNAPGAERRIAAMAHQLPFDDQSVDLILSSWFLFAWLRDPSMVQTIFEEFWRVLKPGGEVRVYPTPHWEEEDHVRRGVPEGFGVEQYFRAEFSLLNMPPAFMTCFRKPA